MAVKDIRNYILSRLFFPKVAIIDKPGIIISKTSSKYGKKEIKRRNIFLFEDIIADLQKKTIKKLGYEKASNLWYKIGKDTATLYMMDSKGRKIPKILESSIIEYIFSSFRAAGMSLAKEIRYNQKNERLNLFGKDNIICRKSRLPSFSAGTVSGIISVLLNKNIESKISCQRCPDFCQLMTDNQIKKIYVPYLSELKKIREFSNMDAIMKYQNLNNRFFSFKQLIKFKKAHIDEYGKYYIYDFTIIPCPSLMVTTIYQNYIKIDERILLDKSISDSAENIGRGIIPYSEDKKIKVLQLILVVLGWGIPHYSIKEKKIIFDFVHPPYSRYSHLYLSNLLKGFINSIYQKEVKIKEIKKNKNNRIILKIVFEV